MSKTLHIGHDVAAPQRRFELPLDAVTETFVVFGKKGSGKSNAGVVLAEELYKLRVPFLALDPVGHWWGLKSRPDGTPGLSLFVFGGPHADLPLEPTAGALMADVVLDTQQPMVLCTVQFSGGERARFVTDFAERLLKRELVERIPLHVFLEEADQFAPQRPMKGEERMLGAVDKLVRQGRQGGVGVTAITQRSAAINKNVTNQVDCLLAFRTLGPQDRDAVDSWIQYHEGGDRRREVIESLATLPNGCGWLWAPEWLNYLGQVQWRRRETFDAAATPKFGERVVQPKLADVDLEQLRERMAATIERAKADDPRELRKRIAELEREREQEHKHPLRELVEVEKIVERVVYVPDARQLQQLRKDVSDVAHRADELHIAAVAIADRVHGFALPKPDSNIRKSDSEVPKLDADTRKLREPQHPAAAALTAPRLQRPASSANGAHADVSGPQQRILDALARFESIRIDDAQKTQLALFAEASPTSSSFSNNLGALRSAGLIDYPRAGRVALTAAGRKIARPVEVPLSSAELQQEVAQLVGGAKWRILKALIDRYPQAVNKAELAQLAEASPTSSSFSNNVGSLRSLGFLDYPSPGYVAAEPVLFVEEEMLAATGGRR